MWVTTMSRRELTVFLLLLVALLCLVADLSWPLDFFVRIVFVVVVVVVVLPICLAISSSASCGLAWFILTRVCVFALCTHVYVQCLSLLDNYFGTHWLSKLRCL